MGINYNNQLIVTSNLKEYIDFANPKSFTSGNTTIKNMISSRDLTFTISGTPTTSSDGIDYNLDTNNVIYSNNPYTGFDNWTLEFGIDAMNIYDMKHKGSIVFFTNKVNNDATQEGYLSLAARIMNGISAIEEIDGYIYIGSGWSLYNNHLSGGVMKIDYDGNPVTNFTTNQEGTGFYAVEKIKEYDANSIIYCGTNIGHGGLVVRDKTTGNFVIGLSTNNSVNGGITYDFSIDPTKTYIYVFSNYITTINGYSVKGIFRVNYSDLSHDSTFLSDGTGFDNGAVYDSVIDSNGYIYCVGTFTSYKGTTVNRICKIDPNTGNLDATFTANMGTGFNNTVYSMQLTTDNKLIIGGSFTSYNGTTANRLIRLNLDGTIDTTFSPTVNPIQARDIKIMQNGKYLIAAYTTTSPGKVFVLNTDGGLDTVFSPTVTVNGNVTAVLEISNGQILIGGPIPGYDSTNTPYGLLKFNSDGSVDTTFNQNYTYMDGYSPAWRLETAIRQENNTYKLLYALDVVSISGNRIRFDYPDQGLYLWQQKPYHITYTFDRSTYTIKTYVDGKYKDSMTALNLNFKLKLDYITSHFKIKYIKLYDRVLTDSEILQNYEAMKWRLQ